MQPKDSEVIFGAAARARRRCSRRPRSEVTKARLRAGARVAFVTCAGSLTGIGAPVAQYANADAMDRSVKPGDDFYRYANGAWLKWAAERGGQASYDNRAMLTERTSQRVRDLIEEAAASHPSRGSVAQKVGDYYASLLDEGAIEAKGLKPLADEMTTISAITNKAALSAYLGATLNTGFRLPRS